MAAKYLNSGIPQVFCQYVILSIYSQTSWCIELSIVFTIWAKTKQKFSIMVKHLKKQQYQILKQLSISKISLFLTGNLFESGPKKVDFVDL